MVFLVASVLSSESNNTNLLVRLLIAVRGTSLLLHMPNTPCSTTWRLVLGNHRQRFSDVSAPYQLAPERFSLDEMTFKLKIS